MTPKPRLPLAALCLAPVLALADGTDRPNIVCILADDVGYADLGCYGATLIRTPALDRLAVGGVRFTDAYAPASTSSPSRYALLTGQYAWRRDVGILPADAPLAIGTDQPTLPRMLQRLGYRTGLVGKWHLGLGCTDRPVDFNGDVEPGPLDVGFDYAYYFPATNDRVPCVYVEGRRVVGLDPADPIRVSYRAKVGDEPTGRNHPGQLRLPYHLGHDGTIVDGISRIGWMAGGQAARWRDEEMADTLAEHAVRFIRAHRDAPFFLYYATHNAHEPRVPSPAFRGRSGAGLYGDVIEELDHCVARVVDALKEEGLYDNTLIIFTSDNAPMIKEGYADGALEHLNGHNPYAHLRGEKYSLHEGGHRVPLIVSWPRRVRTPFVQRQPFGYVDLAATLAALLGAPLAPAQQADGRDASALFLRPDAPRYRDYILTQDNGGQIALRAGRWKDLPARKGTGAELYDLEADPSELHNVVYAYPDTARRMQQYAAEARRQP